jgi:hypothetical protein
MRALVSGVVGAVVAAVLVLGGTSTYNNVSTTDKQHTDPASVGYGDQ